MNFKDILSKWKTHSALWLLEKPNLLISEFNFIFAIQEADLDSPEEAEFLVEMAEQQLNPNLHYHVAVRGKLNAQLVEILVKKNKAKKALIEHHWDRYKSLLLHLVNDSDKKVLYAIARIADIDTIKKIAAPSCVLHYNENLMEISEQVASSNDKETLMTASLSTFFVIRKAVSSNECCPAEAQEILVQEKALHKELARNKNSTPECLRQLAKSQDSAVRLLVAKHPNTPYDVLSELSRDNKNRFVYRAAQKVTANRKYIGGDFVK